MGTFRLAHTLSPSGGLSSGRTALFIILPFCFPAGHSTRVQLRLIYNTPACSFLIFPLYYGLVAQPLLAVHVSPVREWRNWQTRKT